MSIATRKAGDVTILDLKGKLVLGDEIGEFRDAVVAALEEKKPNILLNLKNLSMMDSSGLGELVRCYTSAKRLGGTVKIVNLSSKINELLFITKLITVFEAFEDEQKAINSF